MDRWMCGAKLQDRVPSKGLIEDWGLDDNLGTIAKQDNDWVKKCMEYEVEGARPRGSQRGRP